MHKKAGPPAQVKVVDEDKGQVEAVFATMDVIDKDGDVTRPGAFGEQKVRVSAFNHQSWGNALPVGKGAIHEQGNQGLVKSQFFMDTTAGRDHFHVIKEMDDLMEWSYGFDILEKAEGKWPEGDVNGQDVRFLLKQKVHEVSPVILGAGVDTRTLSAKSSKSAIGYAKSATTDVAWDVALMRSRITADSAALRSACAWVDSSADANAKSSYKFLHHMVSENGAVGAANTRACSAAIAILNGGRGGANIPDGDRQGVYDHVAHHMRDAGAEPPPLKSQREVDFEMKLFDLVAVTAWDLDEVVERLVDAVEDRTEKGRQLSEPTMDMVKWMLSSQERLREALASEPRKQSPQQQQLLKQIARDSQALLFLTGGYDGS